MKRIGAVVGLSWLTMLGFDLFLHGALLARFYLEPSPFLLERDQLFARIPLGYAAFLLHAVLLVWLMVRLGVTGAGSGARFGLVLGALLWAASTLGLVSATTADPWLMAGWLAGETAQMTLAGAVAGAGLGGARLGRLLLVVLGVVVAAGVLTFGAQSLGLVPTS